MADYYPLIAKAVAGLQNSTPETRGAIYQRARNALLGQLRRLDPPIPESDVARESASLEIAITRLEAEFAPPPEVETQIEQLVEFLVETRIEEVIPVPPADVEAPAEIEAPPRPAPTDAEAPPAATPEPVEEQTPRPSEEPRAEESSQERPETALAPPIGGVPGSDASAADATHPFARPQPAPPPAFFKSRRDKPPLFAPSARPDGSPAHRAPGSPPTFRRPSFSPAFPPPPGSAAVADAASSAPPSAPGGFADQSQEPIIQEPFAQEPDREESAPQDREAREFVPDGFGADAADFEPVTAPDAAADLVVEEPGADESAAERRISPALAKPRPEVQRPSAPQPRRDAATPRRLWIVGFVVGLLVFLVAIAAFQLRERPEDLRQKTAAPVIAPEAGSNGKIVDRIGLASDGTQSAPASSSSDNAAGQGASAARSAAAADEAMSSGGRAALLVEAPDEPSKVKTYLGSVVWKVDNVSNGPGDPLSMAVTAEIDIPEEKLKIEVTLQKNFDGGLPASHTMKIQFTEAPGGPLGAIQQISVPQMRRENVATGDGLSGIPVAITDNSFLVGLTRGGAEASNIDLLTSREWIDVPMLLTNGKIAKLTFEKGPTGVRAITDALAAWKSQ